MKLEEEDVRTDIIEFYLNSLELAVAGSAVAAGYGLLAAAAGVAAAAAEAISQV